MNIGVGLARIAPHRIIASIVRRSRFAQFAKQNGLVYFGTVRDSDDHDPIRGFTAQTGQSDAHVIHGAINGQPISLLERTVDHTADAVGNASIHSHTWLIAAIKYDIANAPHLLFLSHAHPRLHDEAAAIHHDRSKHIPIQYQLDANYLIYAKPDAAETFRERLSPELVEALLAYPDFDYEFAINTIYIYSHSKVPTAHELTRILTAGLVVTETYEKSLV